MIFSTEISKQSSRPVIFAVGIAITRRILEPARAKTRTKRSALTFFQRSEQDMSISKTG